MHYAFRHFVVNEYLPSEISYLSLKITQVEVNKCGKFDFMLVNSFGYMNNMISTFRLNYKNNSAVSIFFLFECR